VKKVPPILGSIMYLNSPEVDNLLESLEGGLVEQFRQTAKSTSVKSGEGTVGIPKIGLGVEGQIASGNESAREEVGKTTPVSRLASLRAILIEREYVQYINSVSEELRPTLTVGALVEITGELNVSAFTQFIDMASGLLNLRSAYSGLFGNLINVDAETEQVIRYLADVAGKGIPVCIRPARASASKRDMDFACILSPDHMRVSRDELMGNVSVLGRIKRVLARNEVVYFYELVPGMSRFSGTQMKVLVKKLTSSQKGPSFTEQDLRLRYPSVLVTPIAIYS